MQFPLNYSFWLALLLPGYLFIDAFRRFYDGSRFLLLSIDFIVLLIFATFFVRRRRGPSYNYVTQFIYICLFAYVFAILLAAINPYFYSPITTVAGLRAYLLPIPFLWIGYCCACNYSVENWKKFSNYILFWVLVAIAFAVVQMSIDPGFLGEWGSILFKPMDSSVKNYYDQTFNVVSSFFASSKRFGKFLLFSFLLIMGARLYSRVYFVALITIFFIGVLLTGAREALVLLVVSVVFLIIMKGGKKFFFQIMATIMLATIILFGWATKNNDTPQNREYSRLEVMASVGTLYDYGYRLSMMAPVFHVNESNDAIWFGLGVGKYGQESLLDDEVYRSTYGVDRDFFNDLDFFSRVYSFADGGMAKLIIELGVFTTIYILVLCGCVLLLCLNVAIISASKKDGVGLAFSLIPVLWLVLFLKAHVTMSDIINSVIVFFSIGVLWQKYHVRNSSIV
ncbi:hypothetical protein [Maricurvus nonylphenolicus]|uniref:hypothetical protein n=1 Tax=Maricurvus nonylphenolicus TaxID=1008307 RepID=UPI0036F2558A